MKFLLLIAVGLATGQQFQQNLESIPAVRLAGSGFFQQGNSLRSGSTFNDRNQNNQIQNRESNNQLNSFSSNRNSDLFSTFQNGNQFQSGRDSFQQNQQNNFNSFDDSNQNRFQVRIPQENQQDTFSFGAFQQGNGNGIQSTTGVSTSQNFNNDFSSEFNQEISRIQPQTFVNDQQDSRRNRLSAINIQLTPSVRFQNQQTSTTSFQPNRIQQNSDNRFQQTDFSRFEGNNNNNIQFNANNQQSSRGQFQSSNRLQLNSASSFDQFSDETDGGFEPLNLPSGASRLLGSISSSFSCNNRPYGYYADQDNSCRVFHICNPALFSDGKIETYQYSFMCGENTIFDQDAMTCKAEYDATPCQEANNFYFRNEQFGRFEDKNF